MLRDRQRCIRTPVGQLGEVGDCWGSLIVANPSEDSSQEVNGLNEEGGQVMI